MESTSPHAILIVGGGASGVLLAAHLLASGNPRLRVTLIEKRARIGQGLAYSTPNAGHVLNVPAGGMSAFPDDPDHFWRWLAASGLAGPGDDAQTFFPRSAYGRYLESLTASDRDGPRLVILNAECTGIAETEDGVEARLSDGSSVAGRLAVLALGHEERQMRGRGLAVRAGSPEDTPVDPYARVMILGSGLSMVDAWLSLAGNDHQGPILAVSRHGLLPRRHQAVEAMAIDPADIPFEAGLLDFSNWFIGLMRRVESEGGDWRAVVDGLRPFIQRIWQGWPLPTRRRFLAHLRPFWNIHRHRLPPALYDALTTALDDGRITLIAGTFLEVAEGAEGLVATIRRRGLAGTERFEIARLYDCGGVAVNVAESSNPLVRHLVRTGLGRPDPLQIGLDVTRNCALIGREGAVSKHLFAVGPLTRSAFFEIESVPEIRVQARSLAARLLAPVPAG